MGKKKIFQVTWFKLVDHQIREFKDHSLRVILGEFSRINYLREVVDDVEIGDRGKEVFGIFVCGLAWLCESLSPAARTKEAYDCGWSTTDSLNRSADILVLLLG